MSLSRSVLTRKKNRGVRPRRDDRVRSLGDFPSARTVRSLPKAVFLTKPLGSENNADPSRRITIFSNLAAQRARPPVARPSPEYPVYVCTARERERETLTEIER